MDTKKYSNEKGLEFREPIKTWGGWKTNRLIILSIILILIILIVIVAAKIYIHEKWQSKTIHEIETSFVTMQYSIRELSVSLNEANSRIAEQNDIIKRIGGDGVDFAFSCSEEGYDVLFIGNSITIHNPANFWWGKWGMAASSSENDYAHRVVKGLEDKLGEKVNYAIRSYSVWETQAYDRAETSDWIDLYLNKDVDMIFVQLSENCKDLTTFDSDFKWLIKHITELSPHAQIVVIGDFWSQERSNMKEEICNELGIDFVDLSDLYNMKEYKAGVGTKVWGDDGMEHIIEHSGVASHPGDEGMKCIADKVLKQIDIQ